MTPDDLSPARARIAAAYAPEAFAESGERVVNILTEHLGNCLAAEGKVIDWEQPDALVRLAQAQLDKQLPVSSTSDRVGQLVCLSLQYGINLHHRRYVGHQVPASVPLAGLFDLVGSVTNQAMAIYEMGPWATAVEHALIDAVGSELGFPSGQFAGLVTSGGSLANLTALLTARNVSLKGVWNSGMASHKSPPVILTHEESHYCVTRSAGILGLGTDQIIRVRLDTNRHMDPNHLEEVLRDLRARNIPIIAVSAAACATPIGAFDPLEEIGDACRRHEVWLHVDAAHGGATCFSNRHRHLIAGIEKADSVVCDAHKMMFMPALCAMVFYREREVRHATFHQDAPYLFDPSAPHLAEYDSGLTNVECTKRAAAFGLWAVWSIFGKQLFADLVDVTFDLAATFYELLKEAEDFQVTYEPQCNIVVFRYVPKNLDAKICDSLQFRLRRSVIESGDAYLVASRIDDRAFLRTTIINPQTTEQDLKELLSIIRCHAEPLISTYQ